MLLEAMRFDDPDAAIPISPEFVMMFLSMIVRSHPYIAVSAIGEVSLLPVTLISVVGLKVTAVLSRSVAPNVAPLVYGSVTR